MIRSLLQFPSGRPLRNGLSIGLLSTRPPVFHAKYWRDFELTMAPLQPLFERLRKRSAFFVFSFGWSMEYPDRAALVRAREHAHRQRYPKHRWIFLAATRRELEILLHAGLDALFVSQNCFVDERLFTIAEGIRKSFDAVYDARLSAFKRHQLAKDLPSLALISYLHKPSQSPEDQRYAAAVRSVLPQAHWFNDPYSLTYRRLSAAQVADRLNRCRIGLCLSAEEGGMYASIQYLLCGLPVVSTASKGGRAEFFDSYCSRVAEDSPVAVRECVDDLLANPPLAHEVRERTLRRIRDHRQRLLDRITQIRRDHGNRAPYAPEWQRRFTDKLVSWSSYRSLYRRLEGDA